MSETLPCCGGGTAAGSAPPPPTGPPDPLRWAALGQLCLVAALNNCQWINFAAVVDQSRAYYGVDNAQLNWLSVCYMTTFVVCAPFSIQAFRCFGLKRGIVAGSALNCAGAGVKFLCAIARPGFWCLFLGQQLAACAQLFLLASGPLLSAVWFPETERTIATAAATTCGSQIGAAVGLLIPPLVIRSASKGDFTLFFGLQFAATVVDLSISVFVIPAHPTRPPSAAAAAIHAEDSERRNQPGRSWPTLLCEFLQQTVDSMRNAFGHSAGFRWLTLAFGVMIGAFWTTATLIAQLFAPFGVSEANAGAMGFTSIFVGIAAALAVSRFVDRRRVYWLPGAVLAGGGSLAMTLIVVLFLSNGGDGGGTPLLLSLLWVAYTLVGAAVTSYIPVVMEMAVEHTFPIDEAVSSGVCMISANFFGAVFTLSLQVLLQETATVESANHTGAALAVIFAAAAVCHWLTPESRRRLAFEHLTADKKSSTISATNADQLC